MKDSIFVRDLLPEEQRRYEARQEYNARRLTTAMKIITDAEFIVQLSRLQELNTKFNHLCNIKLYSQMRYIDIVNVVKRSEYNDALILSSIPPIFQFNEAPLYF